MTGVVTLAPVPTSPPGTLPAAYVDSFAVPVAYAAGINAQSVRPATSVTYNGSFYVCVTAHTTTATFDSGKWLQIVSKGSPGADGAKTFGELTGQISASQLIAPTALTLGAVKSSSAGASQFATGINTSGDVTYAQPTFNNLASTSTQLFGAANTWSAVQTVNTNSASALSPPSGTALQVAGPDGIMSRISLDGFDAAASLSFRRANTSAASPSALVSGDTIAQFTGFGYTDSGYTGAGKASVTLNANENWSGSAQGTFISFLTTSNGATTNTERMRIGDNVGINTTSPSTTLHVSGPIRCGSFTVGTLPSAASVGDGSRAIVTDNTTAFSGSRNTAPSGGGANKIPVIVLNGSWICL